MDFYVERKEADGEEYLKYLELVEDGVIVTVTPSEGVKSNIVDKASIGSVKYAMEVVAKVYLGETPIWEEKQGLGYDPKEGEEKENREKQLGLETESYTEHSEEIHKFYNWLIEVEGLKKSTARDYCSCIIGTASSDLCKPAANKWKKFKGLIESKGTYIAHIDSYVDNPNEIPEKELNEFFDWICKTGITEKTAKEYVRCVAGAANHTNCDKARKKWDKFKDLQKSGIL